MSRAWFPLLGGITYAGLKLLGEPTPWVNGWRHRPIGKTIQVDEGEFLAEQAIVAAKHDGTYVKGFSRIHGTEFTPDQIAAIRAEYATDRHCGKKSLAKKWGCGGKKIGIIIADLFNLRHAERPR